MTRKNRPSPMLVVALAVCVGVGGYLYYHLPTPGPGPQGGPPPGQTTAPGPGTPNRAEPSAPQAMDVAIVQVEPAKYRANIRAFGEASAHYQLDLSTQVAGRIVSLSDAFENGRRIARDETLLQIEDTSYQAAIATAENELAAAELALLEEQRQGLQAEAEWKASRLAGEPDSPLVLREPQLAAAQAAVATSEANLRSARYDLDQTRMVAPFDALVVERLVAPGAYVQAGTEVATLYSTDRIEIRIALSARDWQNLPDDDLLTAGDWPARLTDVENGQQWEGHVIRVERHRDETTRQRALVVAVDRPLDLSPPLLPGTFVEARVAGSERDNLWKLPISALSQRGEIWYVTASDTLGKIEATPAFSDADSIYVPAPEQLDPTPQRVLVHPLNGYLEGTQVNPTDGEDDA